MSDDKQHVLTRRRFLELIGGAASIAATGSLLGACSSGRPVPAPTPTSASAKASMPTSPPAAATAAPTQVAAVKKATTIEFWHWLNQPDDPTWKAILAEFEQKHPDIKVNVQLVPLNDFRQKSLAANQAGNPPDISRIHPQWLGEFYEIDALLELDDLFGKAKFKDDLGAMVKEIGRPREGKPLLTLPVLGLMVYVQYYRKDLFDAAGVKPDGSQQDWLNAMKALSKNGVYGFSMRGGRQGWAHGWAPFIMQNGIKFVDDKGNIDIASDVAVETNEMFASVFWNGWAPPDSVTADYAQVVAHWKAGDVACFFHGVHASTDMIQTQKDKVQAAALPYGKKKWTRADSVGFGIWKKSKNREAAWVFMDWLMQSEQHARIAGNPVEPNVPALASVQSMKQFQENRFVKAAIDQREYWGMLPYWHPYWSALAESDWHPNFQKVLQKQMTSKQFLQKLADGFAKEGMPKR